MQTPVEIDFQGFTPSEWQVKSVQHHMEMFEQKYERISSGRITVKWPGAHHRKGGPYEINIRLRLPTGKEVDVSRTPHLDERHADFNYALNDAFKRARRQLQDKVRQLQEKVKAHEAPQIGRILRLFEDHGFLSNSAGLEIYFHKNSVLNGGFAKLKPGIMVHYSEEEGEKGPQAGTVRLAGKHGMMNTTPNAPGAAAHWEHFPHDADVGIRGFGPSMETAFEQAALALTAVITDAKVNPETKVDISCSAPDPELLFADWINGIIYQMAVRRMIFGRFMVKIEGGVLSGSLWGETVDRERHKPVTEPKGATYTALKVGRVTEGTWTASCVVDV